MGLPEILSTNFDLSSSSFRHVKILPELDKQFFGKIIFSTPCDLQKAWKNCQLSLFTPCGIPRIIKEDQKSTKWSQFGTGLTPRFWSYHSLRWWPWRCHCYKKIWPSKIYRVEGQVKWINHFFGNVLSYHLSKSIDKLIVWSILDIDDIMRKNI